MSGFSFTHTHPPTNIQEHLVSTAYFHTVLFAITRLIANETCQPPWKLYLIHFSIDVMSLIIFVISKCWCEDFDSYQTFIVKRMPQPTALAIAKRLFKNIHLKIYFSKLILDCNVFICDFHREQAWERWLNAIRNGVRMIKIEMLSKFRRISRSRTEK